MPEEIYPVSQLLLPRELEQLLPCRTCGPHAKQEKLELRLTRLEASTGYIRCTVCGFAAPSSSAQAQDVIASWNGANKQEEAPCPKPPK